MNNCQQSKIKLCSLKLNCRSHKSYYQPIGIIIKTITFKEQLQNKWPKLRDSHKPHSAYKFKLWCTFSNWIAPTLERPSKLHCHTNRTPFLHTKSVWNLETGYYQMQYTVTGLMGSHIMKQHPVHWVAPKTTLLKIWHIGCSHEILIKHAIPRTVR